MNNVPLENTSPSFSEAKLSENDIHIEPMEVVGNLHRELIPDLSSETIAKGVVDIVVFDVRVKAELSEQL